MDHDAAVAFLDRHAPEWVNGSALGALVFYLERNRVALRANPPSMDQQLALRRHLTRVLFVRERGGVMIWPKEERVQRD